MTITRSVKCDGFKCGIRVEWHGRPTLAQMATVVRGRGWTVTKDGRHYCDLCAARRRKEIQEVKNR